MIFGRNSNNNLFVPDCDRNQRDPVSMLALFGEDGSGRNTLLLLFFPKCYTSFQIVKSDAVGDSTGAVIEM